MWMGLGQSWSRWAEAWWDLRWKDQCEVAELHRQSDQARRHVLTAQSWGDVMWMMPNGDLEPAWAGDGGWRVWLVTRSGSAAGMREWAILRNWMTSQAPKDVSWGVLSVDASEQGWASTLAQRENVRERIPLGGSRPKLVGPSGRQPRSSGGGGSTRWGNPHAPCVVAERRLVRGIEALETHGSLNRRFSFTRNIRRPLR